MIGGWSFFDQPIRNDAITHDNMWKITTGLGDDCTIGFLLDYNYIKNYCKMKAIDLSKPQAFDAAPEVMQQINFTGNLEQQVTIFFIIEEAKDFITAVWDFSQGSVKVFFL